MSRCGCPSRLLCGLLAALWTGLDAQSADQPAEDAAASTFRRLDMDSDASLSSQEFVAGLAGDVLREANRQYRTFDFNHDRQLSVAEFRSVPLYVAVADRGPLIDPFVERAGAAFRRLDERWKDADADGNGRLSEQEFRTAEISAIVAGLEDSAFAAWDRDGDGQLTPQESRFALDVAFGVRRPQGEELRLKDGCSISWLGFKFFDRDRDDRVTLEEARLGYDGELAEPRFRESDADRDGVVSFAEWSTMPYRAMHLVGQFLAIDADFSGSLSLEEVVAGIPEWQRPIPLYLLPAFDDDQDGQLSLPEFLMTPAASGHHRWHEPRPDLNANGRLEFTEFRWNEGLDAVALEAEFFRRLDRNQDGALTIDEYFFRTEHVPVRELFLVWDRNSDGRVSESEFVIRSNSSAVALGEFRFADQDTNAELSPTEFSLVRSIVGPEFRGPVEDPWSEAAGRRLSQLREALGENRKPTPHDVVAAASTAWRESWQPLVGPVHDADGDGIVSEAELTATVRHWLGLETLDGTPLHEADGRVCNLMLFLHLDSDKDGHVSHDEYTASPYTAVAGEAAFASADADHNGRLTPKEWWQVSTLGSVDPISEFLHLDENRNGQVDRKELLARCPDWKIRLAATVFPGFDADGDGALSLREYRLTPVANPILEWQRELVDQDNDGRLTLEELRYDQDPFALVRLELLERLDRNRNQVLEDDEFLFRTTHPDVFYVVNADGTEWRRLFEFEGYQACGSPTVLPNGKEIAFDAWKVRPERTSPVICIAGIDGRNPREVLPGSMPSFSPDGARLTFSSSGIPIANREWKLEKQVAADAWGCQWSPDGQSIAFYARDRLLVMDVATEAIREVFGGAANPFSGLFWNLTWSPDSRQICLKASPQGGGEQIVIVDALGAELGLRVRHSGTGMNSDFAWHPGGDRIVVSMFCPERGRSQLYEFNPNDDKPPTLFPGQNPATNNTDACWTPDGRELIIVVGDY